MSEALKSLRQVIEGEGFQLQVHVRRTYSASSSPLDSDENGPTEEPIHIPSELLTTWISKWEMECQVLAGESLLQTANNSNPTAANATPRVIENSNEPTVTSTSANLVTQGDKMVEDGDSTGMIDYHEAVADPECQFEPLDCLTWLLT